jgi:hypothetical protein
VILSASPLDSISLRQCTAMSLASIAYTYSHREQAPVLSLNARPIPCVRQLAQQRRTGFPSPPQRPSPPKAPAEGTCDHAAMLCHTLSLKSDGFSSIALRYVEVRVMSYESKFKAKSAAETRRLYHLHQACFAAAIYGRSTRGEHQRYSWALLLNACLVSLACMQNKQR